MSLKDSDFVEKVWKDRALLSFPDTRHRIEKLMEELDRGFIRVAEKVEVKKKITWQVNEWVKKTILLYFAITQVEKTETAPFVYADKIPLKPYENFIGFRAVPGSVVRYGAHVEPGAILMPSLVNIGAYVGAGTMVDTWATVGSCAQIGKRVHLSGGVGIGGVLEPPQAQPVIIEDDVFVGSRCIVVEGVHVGEAAVLGAGVVLTASTKIIDVSGKKKVEMTGYVPPRSIVIPGVRDKKFKAGTFAVPCALIIGERKASTDLKTSLNSALRDFEVPV